MTEPVRRHAYQPPAYLVDRVALTLELAMEATRVRSELILRRNPAATNPGDAPAVGWRGAHTTRHLS